MACPHPAENGNIVARNGNTLLPFSATLLPGVDRPLNAAGTGAAAPRISCEEGTKLRENIFYGNTQKTKIP